MYKKLIDNIFSDFKDFFVDIKFSKFIKYRFVDDMSGGMKVSRTGSKAYIAISDDIKFLDINNDSVVAKNKKRIKKKEEKR